MDRDLDEVRRRLSDVADPFALLVGIFAHAPVGLQIYRADGRCVLVNRAFRDIFGTAPPPEYNVLEDRQLARLGVLELTRRAFAGESFSTPPVWYDARQEPTARGAGHRCAVTCTGFPLLDAAGRVAHVALVFEDVTAELAVREEAVAERDQSLKVQQQLQALFDHAPVLLFVKDLQGRHLVLSREAQRTLGVEPAEAYGKTARDLFGSAGAAVCDENDRRALELRAPVQDIELIPTRSGVRDYLVTHFPILDATGTPTNVAGIAVDITEQRQAAEHLRRSEERFSQMFRALPMAALLSRMSDKRFLDVNEAWERLTGWPRAEQIGRTSIDLELWHEVAQRDALFAELGRRGVVRDFAAKMHTRSGELRDTLLSVDLIDIGGEPSVLLIAHDVTELRRLERELRQSQKMEAIGRLAGGLAHDFNNILTAIGGAGTLLLDQLPAGDSLRPYAEQIQRSTRRAAALTHQLLTFTRKQPIEPVVLDPNDAVRATADMLQRMIGADVELRLELGARGRVKTDTGAIEQVLMNLAINARDAMPAGGT
ncbi:MAG TPA: PAS domain S-box protein, partial [Polyangia bacterium]